LLPLFLFFMLPLRFVHSSWGRDRSINRDEHVP
jgi:hypothetical protein